MLGKNGLALGLDGSLSETQEDDQKPKDAFRVVIVTR